MDIIDDWTLPWPAIKVPTYQTRRVGAWELRRQNQPVLRGYFRGLQACTENYLLMRDNRVWMSLSPVEIESLAPHVAHMRGHVVIAGLGMGLALYNALLRPAVRQITVLELDSEVIALFAAIMRPDMAGIRPVFDRTGRRSRLADDRVGRLPLRRHLGQDRRP
jgi:hypothetical protein